MRKLSRVASQVGSSLYFGYPSCLDFGYPWIRALQAATKGSAFHNSRRWRVRPEAKSPIY